MSNSSVVSWAVVCLFGAMAAHAQTFTTLASFQEFYGTGPEYVSLIQATDGNFYGTAFENGGVGSVFGVTPAGTVSYLTDFSGTGDGYPYAGVVQAADGNFYGTTWQRGVHNAGTLYEVSPNGTLNVFYSFCSLTNCGDGGEPFAPLILANDGKLYGTASIGGSKGYGTVFAVTSSGSVTTLHSFNFEEGATPAGALIQAQDGNLYGTTVYGGKYGNGAVFRMTAGGQLKTLYSFCAQKKCADGANPYAGLVEATDGSFYGTTYGGGAHGHGTVFRMTATGKVTTLYSFCVQKKCTDGAGPYAGDIQASDGNLYGTTSAGGEKSWGTIYQITLAGHLTSLHSFCQSKYCSDGGVPTGGLIQASSGTFYGTTTEGGQYERGTVYSLSPGLLSARAKRSGPDADLLHH